MNAKPSNPIHMVDVINFGDVRVVRFTGATVKDGTPSAYASCLLTFRMSEQKTLAEFLARLAVEIRDGFPEGRGKS